MAPLPLTRDPDIGIAAAGDVPAATVRVGDCLVDLPSDTYGRAVGLGRCDENHYSEVVGIIRLSGGYDAARLTSDATSGCAPKLAPYDDAGYLGTALLPSKAAWRHGVLGALCLVSDPRHDFLSDHVDP